jgi:carboxylesterase type B
MQQRYQLPRFISYLAQLTLVLQFRPICVGTSQTPGQGIDEDCLFVNIFTPSAATPDSKLPVWVYIQGGGYSTNSNANYNGTKVIQESGNNIIFVNFNYRVGVFGFLAGEAVRDDGDLNAGLLDQRLLLHWVQKYIHKVESFFRW